MADNDALGAFIGLLLASGFTMVWQFHHIKQLEDKIKLLESKQNLQ